MNVIKVMCVCSFSDNVYNIDVIRGGNCCWLAITIVCDFVLLSWLVCHALHHFQVWRRVKSTQAMFCLCV